MTWLTIGTQGHLGALGEEEAVSALQERHVFHARLRSVHAMAFSADGKKLALGGSSIDSEGVQERLNLWDLRGPKPMKTAVLRGSATPDGLRFSPDGKWLGFLSIDEPTVGLWNLSMNEPKEVKVPVRLPRRRLMDLIEFSPDGKTFVTSGGSDLTVRVWDLATDRVKAKAVLRGHKDYINYAAFSPDGKMIVSCSGGQAGIILWEEEQGRFRTRAILPEITKSYPRSLAFTSDGKNLVEGDITRAPGEEGPSSAFEVVVRNWSSGNTVSRTLLKGNGDKVQVHAITPDSKLALIGHLSGRLVLWDIATSRRIAVKDLAAIPSTAVFSADGRTLAVGTEKGMVHLFKVGAP
jgi:WD40 repeat protein